MEEDRTIIVDLNGPLPEVKNYITLDVDPATLPQCPLER